MTDKFFRPMLATKTPSEEILKHIIKNNNMLISPKLDGIRALKIDDVLLSRSLKPIPNKHIQNIAHLIPNGLDGEIIIGEPTDSDCFIKTHSGVMTIDGKPNFKFYSFDNIQDPQKPYLERNEIKYDSEYLKTVDYQHITSYEQFLNINDEYLNLGYEGVILRNAESTYKYGRATIKEASLIKIKKFEDSEAQIISVYELLKNDNESLLDNLGYKKKSFSKSNYVKSGLLGGFVVKDLYSNAEFKIGSGFSEQQRKEIWEAHINDKFDLTQIIKYKYFNHGIVSAPRHPIFLGFRSKLDL